MPKYRGRVDCLLSPPPDALDTSLSWQKSRIAGEYFTNIVQHISSSGPDLGIEMIAANFGLSGRGLGFWDTPSHAGPRAWACFRFHSASLGKFDCLIFQQTGSTSTVNTNFGGPAIQGTLGAFNHTTQFLTLAISFATHPSGSNVTQTDGPWNGTYSLTSASMGRPIWKVTPDSKGSFFSRQNGILGSFSGSRNYMTAILDTGSPSSIRPLRHHVIVSEDSLTLAHDSNNDGTYKVVHFGSFLPRSGTFQESPYVMFSQATERQDQTINYFNNAAPTSPTTPSVAGASSIDGGVSHPNLTSGSRSVTFSTIQFDRFLGYNAFVNEGVFERFPLWVTMYEPPLSGILGVMNHLAIGCGMINGSTSVSSSSVAIGSLNASEKKLLLPWSGPSPGSVWRRTGRTFSIG